LARSRSLVRILTRILARPLVSILILILRRIVRRGDLPILRIGRRTCLTPVTLLTRSRRLLRSRPALLLLRVHNQGWSQR
jgi:hypothetical protein